MARAARFSIRVLLLDAAATVGPKNMTFPAHKIVRITTALLIVFASNIGKRQGRRFEEQLCLKNAMILANLKNAPARSCVQIIELNGGLRIREGNAIARSQRA